MAEPVLSMRRTEPFIEHASITVLRKKWRYSAWLFCLLVREKWILIEARTEKNFVKDL